MARYRVCGIDVESEAFTFALPPAEGNAPGLIRLEIAPASPPAAPEEWLTLREQADGTPWLSTARWQDGYLLRVHGYADFLIGEGGAQVRCAPDARCPPDMLATVFLEQVLPHVLHLFGRPCLHASAVSFGDGAVAGFVGPSGAGKSTLAASFADSAGHVSDDCLALSPDLDGIRVHPGQPTSRLWHDSVEAVMDRTTRTSPVAGSSKLRVCRPSPRGALWLRRLYVLETGDGPPSIEPLRRRDALAAVAAHMHRLDFGDREHLRLELAFLDRLVQLVPIARLRYARRFEDLAQVREAVQADLAGHWARPVEPAPPAPESLPSARSCP